MSNKATLLVAMDKGSDASPISGGESSEFYTPTMSAPSSFSAYQSSRIDSLRESRSEYESAVGFEIAASKSHWTQLDRDEEMEYSPEEDRNHFETLESDYRWGLYDQAYYDEHNLVVGNKIAEGGQAEIYEAKVDGNAKPLVVKVFKEGYPLRYLQRQWPEGMVQHWRNGKTAKPPPYASILGCVKGAVLLQDERFKNRFAFVMEQAWGDLRKHIDFRMLNNRAGLYSRLLNHQGSPYSIQEVTYLMWSIASNMDQLQGYGIIHRDLKASNVLLLLDSTLQKIDQTTGVVADFECSVGVVGTGFWRAPEILQQLKDGVPMSNVIFTANSDVYSYGMTSYEIVTGLTPFEGVRWGDYDHVLSGKNQPKLPNDLNPVIRDVIVNCWQSDPFKRPSFADILEKLKALYERFLIEDVIRKTQELHPTTNLAYKLVGIGSSAT